MEDCPRVSLTREIIFLHIIAMTLVREEGFLIVWITLRVMEDVVMELTGTKGIINSRGYLIQPRQQGMHTMLIILVTIVFPKRGISQQICQCHHMFFSSMKGYMGPVQAKIVALFLITLILQVHNGSQPLNFNQYMAVNMIIQVLSLMVHLRKRTLFQDILVQGN